jgi:hypothetical protein
MLSRSPSRPRRKDVREKMSAGRAALTWIALCGLLGSCSDECGSYSSFSCKQIEAADYNVIFFFPSGTEQSLGQVQGLSQCGQRAHGFAAAKNLSRSHDWGYVCCMIAKGSACFEKHR